MKQSLPFRIPLDREHASCVVFTVIAILGLAMQLGTIRGQTAPRWVGSWMAAPCAPAEAEPRSDQFHLQDETIRQIVHLSAGGVGLRLRFSNLFGATSLVVRSVHVAIRRNADGIDPQTDVAVKFSGSDEITIAPGKTVLSDAVNFPSEAHTDLAVSFFVPGKVTAPAIHYTALQTSYYASGNQTSAISLERPSKTTLWMILDGVDVASRTAPGAIVAVGSSTTDGSHSTPNQNRRWTDDLFRRLVEARAAAAPAVLNDGISGNRVLHDGRGSWGSVWGESAASRFQRDVLSQSGIEAVVIFEGGNDIRQPGSGAVPLSESVSPKQLIAGFEWMARVAHERRVKVIVGTITPFEHADANREEDPVWEQTRQAFNQWARTAKTIDGVFDFDAAIRDPHHPARILPDYDSGDHLHPNDAGYKAMADSIDLSLIP